MNLKVASNIISNVQNFVVQFPLKKINIIETQILYTLHTCIICLNPKNLLKSSKFHIFLYPHNKGAFCILYP